MRNAYIEDWWLETEERGINMEYKKLDEKAIKSWRVTRGIIFLILFAAALGMFFLGDIIELAVIKHVIRVAARMLIVLFGILGIVEIFVCPSIEYRQWKYGITKDRVEIQHGIFFIKRTIIPIIRIQNITVEQGPIARKFDLFSVEMSLASGNHTIPCLDQETADEISENLKDRIYTRLEANERGGKV